MKPFLGLLQLALGVGGIIALFNGEWLLMIGAWVAAMLIGLAGNRAVKSSEGVSQTGQDSFPDLDHALEALEKRNYSGAEHFARSASEGFRMGGDTVLLAFSLMIRSVAQAARGETMQAQNTFNDAERLMALMKNRGSAQFERLDSLRFVVEVELREGARDTERLVTRVLNVLSSGG